MAYNPKYYMVIQSKLGHAHVYLFIDTVGVASYYSGRSLGLILS